MHLGAECVRTEPAIDCLLYVALPQLMERVRNRAAWERQQAQVKRKEEEEAERERSECGEGEQRGVSVGNGGGKERGRNVEEGRSEAEMAVCI